MSWQQIIKVLLGMAVKQGAVFVALCALVYALCWGTYQLGKIWLAQDEQKITAMEMAAKAQKESGEQSLEMTAAFVLSIEASKKSDAKLVENVVLLTTNLSVATEAIQQNGLRLDHQEKLVQNILENGTEPSRKMLQMIDDAGVLMAPVPELRREQLKETKEQLKETKKNGESLDRLNATQDEILKAIQHAVIKPDDAITIPNRRTTGGEETSIKKAGEEWRQAGTK